MEYQIGQHVVHEGTGVCTITGIEEMELLGKGSAQLYYVMKPVYRDGRVCTPVEYKTGLRLRPVATADYINKLLSNIGALSIVEEVNDRVRGEKLKEIMSQFTPEANAVVVKTALIRCYQRRDAGKKFMASDEKILAAAGKKLYEEMAFAVGEDVEQARRDFEDKVNEEYR